MKKIVPANPVLSGRLLAEVNGC